MDSKEIKENLKEIENKLHSIDITLAKQHITLEEHTRRSLANEEQTRLLAEELRPIRKHVSQMEGGLKLLGILSLVLGVIVTFIKLYQLV